MPQSAGTLTHVKTTHTLTHVQTTHTLTHVQTTHTCTYTVHTHSHMHTHTHTYTYTSSLPKISRPNMERPTIQEETWQHCLEVCVLVYVRVYQWHSNHGGSGGWHPRENLWSDVVSRACLANIPR